MDNQRLFIANLSKGKIGHDRANLLGSLITTQFQLAAMRRANQPEDERRDFYLFIDEFQNFTTNSFASLLAEARKYRLCLVLSHQYVDQIPLSIRQAVFGNVGTLFSFRIGNTDAEVLQKEFANQFIAQQFVDLERFNVFTKILENGTNQTPFRGVTLQPLGNRLRHTARHVTRSREKFASTRSSVEAKLHHLTIPSSGMIPQTSRSRRSPPPSSFPKSHVESDRRKSSAHRLSAPLGARTCRR